MSNGVGNNLNLKFGGDGTDSDTTGEPCVEAFFGRGPHKLNVPEGTSGTITSVIDNGSGNVRFSLNGTPPPTNNASGPYYVVGSNRTSSINLSGVDLSKVCMIGTSSSSRFSISYIKSIYSPGEDDGAEQ